MGDIHRIKVLPPASFNGIEFPAGDIGQAWAILEESAAQCPRLARYYGPVVECRLLRPIERVVHHVEITVGSAVNGHE